MKPSAMVLIGWFWILIAAAVYSQLPVTPDFLPHTNPTPISPRTQTSGGAPLPQPQTRVAPTKTPSPAPIPTPRPAPVPAPTPSPAIFPTTTPALATSTPTTTPPATEPTSTPTTTAPLQSSFSQQVETHIHALVNVEREKAGLEMLSWSGHLSMVARAHSRDMSEKGYFSHNDQEGCGSSCRITNSGYEWRATGENIYMMEGYSLTPSRVAETIVKNWMNSSGHRANILSSDFSEEGVGVVRVNETLYATQNFGQPR
jgi:uncharacterized protein YkwD